MAEAICVRLCRHYQERFGIILHHNVDKLLLCGKDQAAVSLSNDTSCGAGFPPFTDDPQLVDVRIGRRTTQLFGDVEGLVRRSSAPSSCGFRSFVTQYWRVRRTSIELKGKEGVATPRWPFETAVS